MNPIHLSEQELQQYALHPLQSEQATIDHVQACKYCSSQIEVYKVVFMSVKDRQTHSFGFDPYELVLPKIHPRQAKSLFPVVPLILILVFAVALISLTGILLIKKQVFVTRLYSSNYPINFVFIAGGILIVVFHVTDLVAQFSKQVKEFGME